MNVFSRASRFVAAWWHLLYPSTCVICGDVLVTGESFMCGGCLGKAPLDEGENQSSVEELQENLGVECVYSLFHYDRNSDYHRWIHALKYGLNRDLGIWSGRMLGERIGSSRGFDHVIPVPLHPSRERVRGFNQSFMIGLGIAEILGVDVRTDIVERVVNTPSQTGLTREERADNVKRAFALHEGVALNGNHLLLVDDVITTGATLRACVDELRKIPGVRISVACLGRAGKI